MTLLTWSHACTVGVKAMDDQHGILMDTMNELRDDLLHGCNREQLDESLERLVDFTRKHFASEEHLLQAYNFPGLLEHRAAHQRLLSEIRKTVRRAENCDSLQVHPLLEFLRSWYMEHIESLDRQYGPWLNARGVY